MYLNPCATQTLNVPVSAINGDKRNDVGTKRAAKVNNQRNATLMTAIQFEPHVDTWINHVADPSDVSYSSGDDGLLVTRKKRGRCRDVDDSCKKLILTATVGFWKRESRRRPDFSCIGPPCSCKNYNRGLRPHWSVPSLGHGG